MNADDFGLTTGINRAVVDLNDAGALTSTTLMAASPRFAEAAALARRHSSLGVGCHIVLVDGSPVADPASISSLLQPSRGASTQPSFRPTLGAFLRDLSLGGIKSSHIEQEATAQILRLQQAGMAITHIDTHKHTHIFPLVLDPVLRAARNCGVDAIRNPFEPAWSIRSTPNAGLVRKLQIRLLGGYRRNFRKLVRERNFATTDGCLGVLATGTLNTTVLRSLLERLPDGTWELVCHPAYMDAELRATRTRLQESRHVELSALQALPGILARHDGDVLPIHFGQLA